MVAAEDFVSLVFRLGLAISMDLARLIFGFLVSFFSSPFNRSWNKIEPRRRASGRTVVAVVVVVVVILSVDIAAMASGGPINVWGGALDDVGGDDRFFWNSGDFGNSGSGDWGGD